MGIHNLFQNCYKGKRVLVTGHTGFKGAWLSLWLNELGANVSGFSLEPPTNPNLFGIVNVEPDISRKIGDIRNKELISSTLEEQQPEIVFHLAAQALVRQSYRDPHETFETNVMGTINLLEAVRNTPSVKVVIIVTSDKCYENREWIYPYRETDPMGGYDPYSASKGCVELIVASYVNSFFNPKEYGKSHHVSVASVRAGNVIGGGDFAEDRLIPDCVRSLTAGQVISIRYPNATRPWQHVLEPLSGYLHLGASMWQNEGRYLGGWNFGPLDEEMITVEKIVQKTIELWGKGAYQILPSPLHEANLLRLDIHKAIHYLKWKPVYNVHHALEKTVRWYKENSELSMSDMKTVTLNQINDYCVFAKEKKAVWTMPSEEIC